MTNEQIIREIYKDSITMTALGVGSPVDYLVGGVLALLEEKADAAYKLGVNDLSKAITNSLPPIASWDGPVARDNSLVHESVKTGIAKVRSDLEARRDYNASK